MTGELVLTSGLRAAFRANPSNETAGRYLQAVLEDEANDINEDDELFDALAEIREYLLHGLTF